LLRCLLLCSFMRRCRTAFILWFRFMITWCLEDRTLYYFILNSTWVRCLSWKWLHFRRRNRLFSLDCFLSNNWLNFNLGWFILSINQCLKFSFFICLKCIKWELYTEKEILFVLEFFLLLLSYRKFLVESFNDFLDVP